MAIMQKPEDLNPADATETDVVVPLEEDGISRLKTLSILVLRPMSKASSDVLNMIA